MEELKDFEGRFTRLEPLQKGFSSDKKYVAETAEGAVFLLRIADAATGSRREQEFDMMRKTAALGVPMPQPVEFGWSENWQSVYSLFSWCEGEDAEAVLPTLTETEQYALGWQSGQIVRTIHSLPAPPELEDWEQRFGRKARGKIEKYRNCGIGFDGDKRIIGYLEENFHLLANRPQCYQHGDYHVGNMVISREKKLSVIDFDRCDFGDPWEEFNRIVWCAAVSPHFATGELNGYFGGRPPEVFFRLLAFYIANNALSSIPWAMPFGEEEVAVMLKQAGQVLAWFHNMDNPVPTWYLGEL
jgi:serine/threonine-protein kinase